MTGLAAAALDPRIAMFVRSAAGVLVATGLLAWLWRSGAVRARRLLGSAEGNVPVLAIVTWTCAVLTMAAMLLGAFGVLNPLTWAALAAGGGLLLRGRTRPARDPGQWAEFAPAWEPPVSRPFLLAVGALVLGRLLFGLRNPPTDVDSILYHMPMVANWMATGGLGVARFEPQQIGSFYPGNVEVMSLGFAWVIGRETLMTAPGVLGLGLLAVAVRRLAIEAGARSAAAEALALALACAPGVMQLTLGLRVENLMAAWFAVALLFALRARRTRARGDLEVALCAAGLLAGCKATGPVLAVLVFAALLVREPLRARLAEVRASRLGLAVLCVTGGFWLVRNAIAAGNPVYPATVTFGSWGLRGLAEYADIARTSQVAMWRAGLTGHITLVILWRYFGPAGLLVALGALMALAALVVPRRGAGPRAPAAILAAVALAATGLTLVQPFSGANAPEMPGGPLTYSVENVRFLMPTLVALVPLAAVGLSAFPAAAVVLACGVLTLPGLLPRAGHLLPALALSAVILAIWTLSRRHAWQGSARRAALVLVPCTIAAALVTLVDPMRDRMADRAWDAIIERFDSVPAAVAREVRAEAGGRPVAVAGVVSVWAFYGRELRGRPEYVPVGYPLADARAMWRFAPDPRGRADARLWRRNLREAGAPFVVLVSGQRLRPVERSWCEGDPVHFSPVYLTARSAVYRVTPEPRLATLASPVQWNARTIATAR